MGQGRREELSGANAGQLGQFGSFAGTDPRDVFGMLKAVSGSIVALGRDKIRGVETSHYRATIDDAKLEQLVPAAQRQSLGSLDQAAKAGGLTRHPDGRVGRRRPARAQALDRSRREAARHRRRP